MDLPILVVCNPSSGGGTSRSRAGALRAALERGGAATRSLETELERDVFAEVDPALYRAIVVVGGDGSMFGAVNGLPGLGTPLALVGTGTVNVLSRERELPLDPERAAELVLAGRTVSMPVLSAAGRRFVLFAEAGFLAGVVRRVNDWRRRSRRHGKAEFARYGLAMLLTSWGRPLTATVVTPAGGTLRGRYSNVLVTRARWYAGAMPMPLDGERTLEEREPLFVGLRSRTPLGHALFLLVASLHLVPLLRRALVACRLIDCWPAREVTVEGPASADVHLDAETDGLERTLPLRVGADGASFPLLVPPSAVP